jgi:hypothetical protein
MNCQIDSNAAKFEVEDPPQAQHLKQKLDQKGRFAKISHYTG